MLVLVLGANFPVMFVGWEGVGLCSYLLIGFWFKKKSARRRRQEGVHRQPHRRLRLHPRHARWSSHASARSTSWTSRQRRGAGPEPASTFGALITVISAAAVHRRHRQVGADPALRLAARRDGRPDAGLGADPRRDDGDGGRLHDRPQRRAVQPRAETLTSSPSSAPLTALMAGTIGLVQNDIKRVLAYSTVSQLGYIGSPTSPAIWSALRAARCAAASAPSTACTRAQTIDSAARSALPSDPSNASVSTMGRFIVTSLPVQRAGQSGGGLRCQRGFGQTAGGQQGVPQRGFRFGEPAVLEPCHAVAGRGADARGPIGTHATRVVEGLECAADLRAVQGEPSPHLRASGRGRQIASRLEEP